MTDSTSAGSSNPKLDALVRRVNALIPNSVNPATRISIHPCDWIELVNEIDDLQKRVTPETPAAQPAAVSLSKTEVAIAQSAATARAEIQGTAQETLVGPGSMPVQHPAPCWCPYCGEPHSPAVRETRDAE